MRDDEDNRDTADPPLRAVSFAVHGTLVHSPRMVEIYQSILKRHGLTANVASLRTWLPAIWQEFDITAPGDRDRFSVHPKGVTGWWHRFTERLCEHLELPPPSRFLSAELFHHFGRAEAWHVYPDVRPSLEALRQNGFRLGIVSNWDSRLPGLLDALDLSSYFDSIVYGAACGFEKPHEQIFEFCLQELEVPPPQALHIGDMSLEDVEGARSAGMKALLLERHDEEDGSLWQSIQPLIADSKRPRALPQGEPHARS